MRQFLQRLLIPPVPHPQTVFFRLYQASFSQDRHVVGDGRLRERYVVLNIAGAHAHAFSNRALAFLLQQSKYFYARWIGHCFKGHHELFFAHRHNSYQYTH